MIEHYVSGFIKRAEQFGVDDDQAIDALSKIAGPLQANVTPDAHLAAIVGSNPLPRGQVMKKLWDYIKANNLQDAKNRRNVNTDAKLKPVFGGAGQVSMFAIMKHVNNHVTK